MMNLCPEVAKSQSIRLLDVTVLGPATIAAGLHRGPLPRAVRGALVLYGLATIGYNLRNYRATRRLR